MIGNLPLIKTKAQYLEEKKDKTNKNEYPRLFKVWNTTSPFMREKRSKIFKKMIADIFLKLEMEDPIVLK